MSFRGGCTDKTLALCSRREAKAYVARVSERKSSGRALPPAAGAESMSFNEASRA